MATTRLTLYSDATYGLVVRSLENVVDGAIVTSADRPAFSITVRKVQEADAWVHVEPGPDSDVPWVMVGDPVERTVTVPAKGADDGLGARTEVVASFAFGPFDDGTTFLYVDWIASILDSQSDRVRVSLAMNWSDFGTNYAVFWAAPAAFQFNPLPKDRYFIAANGGMATNAPRSQGGMRGDGSSFRFRGAASFEPERFGNDVDELEAFYPGVLTTQASAYGSMSKNDTILIHGDLSGRGARIKDTYDGVSVKLMHEILCDSGTTDANGGLDGSANYLFLVAAEYVRVFKAIGDVFGEDLGIEWRRWVVSSVEGRALLPSRARDRADMATMKNLPIWVCVDKYDLEGATNAERLIGAEYRQLIPSPWSDTLAFSSFDLLNFANQDASATHPALVGDVLPDLYDMSYDTAKKLYALVLKNTDKILSVGFCKPRRPQPYDGGNQWDNFDGAGSTLDKCRVKDHNEVTSLSYKSTAQWSVQSSFVAGVSYDGTYTYLRLGALIDKGHWSIYSTYGLGTHANHQQHLGIVVVTHGGTPRYYPIERKNEAAFNQNYVAVAGDITATSSLSDAMLVIWMGDHFIPGYPRGSTVDTVQGNSLCCAADAVGNQPSVKVTSLLLDEINNHFAIGTGVVYTDDLLNPICYESGHVAGASSWSHTPGGNAQVLGWRRICEAGRSFMNLELGDAALFDYMIGSLDGSSKTPRSSDLVTSTGTWGSSPFFITALGDFVRAGFYDNNGQGHLTTQYGKAAYDIYETNGGLSRFTREAILFDWMHARKLVTLGHSASDAGVVGSRPDGTDAYSPLNHADYGAGFPGTIAALVARILLVQQTFSHGNFNGQRMRSLQRIGSAGDPSSIGFFGTVGHDIGSHETGTTRPYLMHCGWADPANRRLLVFAIANPSDADRGDSFRFRPQWYRGLVPGRIGAYRIAKYSFDPTEGVTTTDLGSGTGPYEITEKLAPSEVVAYTFEFISGLQFLYRYDDNAFESLDVPHTQTTARLEPITGQGARFQYGFQDDHPEDDVKIAAMDMRVFTIGRSKNT